MHLDFLEFEQPIAELQAKIEALRLVDNDTHVNINEEIILKNLAAFEEKKLEIDIFQIDDGYQKSVGDWLDIQENKFPNGMKHLADKIHEKGTKAGLWLAPLVVEKKSSLFQEKKDWLLKDEKGNFVVAGYKHNDNQLASYNKEFSPFQTAYYKVQGGYPFLDGDYTVFAEVVEGLEIVDLITQIPTSREGATVDRPLQDVKMKIRMLN